MIQVSTIVPDKPLKPEDLTTSSISIPKRRNSRGDFEPKLFSPKGKRSKSNPLYYRAESLIHQSQAPLDLVEISAPLHIPVPQNDYVYDTAGGKGSTIYIVDSGANSQSQVLVLFCQDCQRLF